jgi:phospholipase C
MSVFRRLLPYFGTALLAALTALAAQPAGARPQAFQGDPALRPLVTGVPRLPIQLPRRRSHGKIKHVVIIMQENRGFDDLFQGYPGANTQSYGYDSNGNKINLQPIPLEANYDLNHDWYSFLTDCNGTGSLPGTNCQNNGFNNEPTGCRNCTDPQYGYVPASETTTYFDMASQYVLADNMFTSQADDSFISHQYIISAQANHAVYFPGGAWGCEGGPSDEIATLNQNRTFGSDEAMCWDVTTLGDELDAKHRSWRFYAGTPSGDGGLWSAYQNIKHIYDGNDWRKDVISPPGQILTDVANGTLATMTWVTPTYENSDHSGFGSNTGPAWVASVVNKIGTSKFWDSTAIFIFWDEWGGWYDHVPPVYEDYDGLGFRVPMLIISPYAKQNYVSHVQYEHGSMLRFAEDEFGLPAMSAADARANSPAADAFDFTQKPRPFQSFAAPRVKVHRGVDYPPLGVNPD